MPLSLPQIALILGTRPEAIKMAPVHAALMADGRAEVRVLATGQHAELVAPALEVFGVRPDLDLRLMRPGQTPGDLTVRVLTAVQDVLRQWRPQAVLVQGDTTTCLAAALAAFHEGLPIGHVEAGLRTGDLENPWPEEMNRRTVDPLCRWCFAPTPGAVENLHREGIIAPRVYLTGNTVVDALRCARRRIEQSPPSLDGIPEQALRGTRLILVTGHRRESFGRPLSEFCHALEDLAAEFPDVAVVYPVHPNPQVHGPVHALLAGRERVFLIRPLDYLQFVALLERCFLVITDSGGIQEEAPSLGKPVLVTRRATERPEAIQAGCARLVGMSREAIVRETRILLTDPTAYARMAQVANPFGDGHAGQRIAAAVLETLLGK